MYQKAGREDSAPTYYRGTGIYGTSVSGKRHVLIPRQDTEVLVEQALCLLEKEKKHKEIVRILDLCTGSGCILLSMLHYVRRKRKIDIYGVGSDISKEALAVAVENAKKLGIEAKFVQGDLFENVEGSFDMILSNPPYIRTSEIERLQEEVRFHDPNQGIGRKRGRSVFLPQDYRGECGISETGRISVV